MNLGNSSYLYGVYLSTLIMGKNGVFPPKILPSLSHQACARSADDAPTPQTPPRKNPKHGFTL